MFTDNGRGKKGTQQHCVNRRADCRRTSIWPMDTESSPSLLTEVARSQWLQSVTPSRERVIYLALSTQTKRGDHTPMQYHHGSGGTRGVADPDGIGGANTIQVRWGLQMGPASKKEEGGGDLLHSVSIGWKLGTKVTR